MKIRKKKILRPFVFDLVIVVFSLALIFGIKEVWAVWTDNVSSGNLMLADTYNQFNDKMQDFYGEGSGVLWKDSGGTAQWRLGRYSDNEYRDTWMYFTRGAGLGYQNLSVGRFNANADIVAGTDITAGGVYNGGSCDIAERYEVSSISHGLLEPGDVVIIDKTEKLKIKKSTEAYSQIVMGVISTKPQMVLGTITDPHTQKINEEDPPVALLGRIPTKVTDENGPIAIGDKIVSSSKPGYGMKCNDTDKCRGAIIGMALEPLEGDEGKIEVLLKTGY